MTHPQNVNYRSVDRNLHRIHSAALAVTAAAFVVTLYLPLLGLLACDFAARAYLTRKASPFFLLSRFVIATASSPASSVDTESKLFAAKVWLGLSVLALYFGLGGDFTVALLLSALLAICTAADALFDICVGSEIYTVLKCCGIEITSLKD